MVERGLDFLNALLSFAALSRMERRERELTFFESLLRTRFRTQLFPKFLYSEMRKGWEKPGCLRIGLAAGTTVWFRPLSLLKNWSLIGKEKRGHCAPRVSGTEKYFARAALRECPSVL